jgi:hypothetical protein
MAGIFVSLAAFDQSLRLFLFRYFSSPHLDEDPHL